VVDPSGEAGTFDGAGGRDGASGRARRQRRRWRWYHGVAFYAGVQAASFGLGLLAKAAKGKARPRLAESLVGNPASNDYYNALRRPVFAPPDWVFAPAWTLNNALQIWGVLHVLNRDPATPGRRAFLALQGGFWVSFTTFYGAYFGLRSPILGAIDTVVGLAFTLGSVCVAAFRMKDGRALASLATVTPWLLLASATSVAVARWNRDEFFAAGPFAEPPAGWAMPAGGSGEQPTTNA
jgi:translocator protein